MVVTEAASRKTFMGDSCPPPTRQAPSLAANMREEQIDQPLLTEIDTQVEGRDDSCISEWWRALSPKLASIVAIHRTIMGGDGAPPTRQVPDSTKPALENTDKHSTTDTKTAVMHGEATSDTNDSSTTAPEHRTGGGKSKQQEGCCECARKRVTAQLLKQQQGAATPSKMSNGNTGTQVAVGEEERWGEELEHQEMVEQRKVAAETREQVTVLAGKQGMPRARLTKEQRREWRRMKGLNGATARNPDGHIIWGMAVPFTYVQRPALFVDAHIDSLLLYLHDGVPNLGEPVQDWLEIWQLDDTAGESRDNPGVEQPEAAGTINTSLFTRRTDPYNSRQMAEVKRCITVGKDLSPGEQEQNQIHKLICPEDTVNISNVQTWCFGPRVRTPKCKLQLKIADNGVD
ncbi:hypothetical protein DFH08DRAFT_825049 [Mycena albidolilacea]|uniref:Uncharacterized protein n=1 Tax=Mycena albidolilacea TaxID=1033008 RepID=A0AAD7E9V4_9AGAR|nr:hypothetical protein DFH08DRAFT_825049 [Mycena albidolilacea]